MNKWNSLWREVRATFTKKTDCYYRRRTNIFTQHLLNKATNLQEQMWEEGQEEEVAAVLASRVLQLSLSPLRKSDG